MHALLLVGSQAVFCRIVQVPTRYQLYKVPHALTSFGRSTQRHDTTFICCGRRDIHMAVRNDNRRIHRHRYCIWVRFCALWDLVGCSLYAGRLFQSLIWGVCWTDGISSYSHGEHA